MAQRSSASIVIPILNQNDTWLRRCVLSALVQTVTAEVVAVVAPETGLSNRLVLQALQREWGNIRVVQQTRKGFPAAVNEGITCASSERVGLLLSDDWLLAGTLEKCLPYDTDIVSTNLVGFTADGNARLRSLDTKNSLGEYQRLRTLEAKADYLSHFFLFRRRAIEEVGGLDETLGDAPGIDDYEFIWTLLEHQATVSIVEEPLYCYRDHDLERLTLRPYAQQIVTLEKILAKHGVSGAERERLLESHGRWFGRPIHVVQAALGQRIRTCK